MMCRRLHFGQVNRLLTFFFIFIVFNPIDRSWALPDQRQGINFNSFISLSEQKKKMKMSDDKIEEKKQRRTTV